MPSGESGVDATVSAAPGRKENPGTGSPAQRKRPKIRFHLYAEFENFKKRAIKECLRTADEILGWENAARDLLEVIDNLERALSHIPEGTDKNLTAGLNMTLAQFRSSLQKQGVQLIAAQGQALNPEFHDAVSQEPSDLPEGQIVREQLKGYTLHGRLLRPAAVVVSSGPLAK